MPSRLRPLPHADVAALLARVDTARDRGAPLSSEDERAVVQHFLAVLAQRHPGKSVEVRVPPYAAVQCIAGARHTRGTPPAVVETDGATWVALARGELEIETAVRNGRVRASGERSNLAKLLPLS